MATTEGDEAYGRRMAIWGTSALWQGGEVERSTWVWDDDDGDDGDSYDAEKEDGEDDEVVVVVMCENGGWRADDGGWLLFMQMCG